MISYKLRQMVGSVLMFQFIVVVNFYYQWWKEFSGTSAQVENSWAKRL